MKAFVCIDEFGNPLQSKFHSTMLAVYMDEQKARDLKPQGSRVVECEIKLL